MFFLYVPCFWMDG